MGTTTESSANTMNTNNTYVKSQNVLLTLSLNIEIIFYFFVVFVLIFTVVFAFDIKTIVTIDMFVSLRTLVG